MKVVLFDIDGTLLLSGGAGRVALQGALQEVLGAPGPEGVRYDGKTDRLIIRETMRLMGFADADVDTRMEEVLARYVARLQGILAAERHRAYTLPGVKELVDAVDSAADLLLGLLTGNIVVGAEAKLRAVALDPARFRVGAFGSDHEDRPALPPIARERASALLGAEVPGGDLVIIGDTPADMECGRGIGARAIGVATGGFSEAELLRHSPVAAFSDLRETARVLEAIRDA
jgi:phosphoglycolate phosphatase-like HAD superfamily hydrolase